ncbi:MAG: hypothetical protein IJA61_02405 [Clostridia bacterium]|nr:hypothetical protein [Clostridia bacterium]
MNTSKNLIEFFANTRAKFKGKFGYAFLGTLISVLPFAAILAAAAWLSTLVSWLFATILVFALALVGIMQVGHIRFIRELAESDNAPSLKVLFSGFKKETVLNYLFLGAVMTVIYLFSAALFVIPLLVVVALYSMVFYFVEHHKYDNYLEALRMTRIRMRRQKSHMYAYKSIFFLAYFVLIVLFVVPFIFSLRIENMAVQVLLIVLEHGLLYLGFSFITTFYSFANNNFFAEVLDYHEKKAIKTAKPEIEEKKEEVAEEKIEKVEKKPAAKRTTTATKTTTKTTAAKKTTATKSTTKKTTK